MTCPPIASGEARTFEGETGQSIFSSEARGFRKAHKNRKTRVPNPEFSIPVIEIPKKLRSWKNASDCQPRNASRFLCHFPKAFLVSVITCYTQNMFGWQCLSAVWFILYEWMLPLPKPLVWNTFMLVNCAKVGLQNELAPGHSVIMVPGRARQSKNREGRWSSFPFSSPFSRAKRS